MTEIYQVNGIKQAAVASLLDMKIEEVPDFDQYPDSWAKVIGFLSLHEYVFNGCLYNPKVANSVVDSKFGSLFGMEGVKGFFIGITYHPDIITKDHLVIIDKMIKIVNPLREEYKETGFPLEDIIGFSGVKQILLIHKKSGNV
jgi:hypothetical protein